MKLEELEKSIKKYMDNYSLDYFTKLIEKLKTKVRVKGVLSTNRYISYRKIKKELEKFTLNTQDVRT